MENTGRNRSLAGESRKYAIPFSNHKPQPFMGRLLSEVEPEHVQWLWPERLPIGKISVLDGDPGLGKSALMLDLAARVSAGLELPDGERCGAAGVVLLSAEDGLADTIRPRLDAAGADTERIVALSTVVGGGVGGRERTLSIPKDLDIVQREIARVDAALLVVDPLMAFLSERTDSHKDQHVRRALTPLAALAERTRTAAVTVRHLSKGEGRNPLYRGGGSIGIIGAARSGLVVGVDPENSEQRIFAANKTNLSRTAPSLVFRVGSAPNGSALIEWLGTSRLNAADVLKEPAVRDKKSALLEAKRFLHAMLKDGPVPSKQMYKDAREAGISESTLKRAKEEIDIDSKKQSDGSWIFIPPMDELDEQVGGNRAGVPEPLEPLDPLGKDARKESETLAYVSEEGQEDQEVQRGRDEPTLRTTRPAKCGHGYSGGVGCYICDPNHPYRTKEDNAR